MVLFAVLLVNFLFQFARTQTCNYDVTVFNTLLDSWLTSRAKFKINETQSGSDMYVPLLKYKKDYSFSVSKYDDLSIQFDQNLNLVAIQLSYQVYYNHRPIYNSLPMLQTFNNPCSSPVCEFSIALARISCVPVTVSIFVDGIATLFEAGFSGNDLLTSHNFNVTQNAVLQVLFDFPYDGGLLPAGYTIFPQANDQGIPILIFSNYLTGPQTPAAIPNYCGADDLHLVLSKPKYTIGQTQIDVAVVPSLLPSNQFPVELTLECDGGISIPQTRLSSTGSCQKFVFYLPAGDLITCYFVAAPVDPVADPYAQSQRSYLYGIPVEFVLPFENVIYQQNEQLPILIDSYDKSVATGTVTILCGTAVDVQSFTTGVAFTSLIPQGPFNSCNLTISNLSCGYFVINPTITITTNTFDSPFSGDLYIIPEGEVPQFVDTLGTPGIPVSPLTYDPNENGN